MKEKRKKEKIRLQKEAHRLAGLFEKIRNGEIYLYADYYHCSAIGLSPEYYLKYKNLNNFIRIYEESASIICNCFYMSMWSEAMHLFELMKTTKIFVYTDIHAYLDLKELLREKRIEINLKKLVACEFYWIYSTVPDSHKAQAIYDFMTRNIQEWDFFTDNDGLLTYLEMPELKECVFMVQKTAGIQNPAKLSEFLCLPDFLDSWTIFLKEKYKKKNDAETRSSFLLLTLLEETVQYQKRDNVLLELARHGLISDESLYWKALCVKELCGDYAEQMELGKKFLDSPCLKKHVYSDVALWIARAALYKKEYDIAEHYCVKAVTYNMNPTTYLLAFMLSRRPEKIKEAALEVLQKISRAQRFNAYDMYEDPLYSMYDAAAFNSPEIHAAVLKIFLGDYDAAVDLYENLCEKYKDEEWNWHLGYVTALLLLILIKECEWQEGCQYMANKLANYIGFSSKYVQAVTKEEGQPDAKTLFQKCILKWKDLHIKIDVQRILPILNLQIDTIIKNSCHNRHFQNAVGFAAAFGEVKESMGEKNGKQRILAQYRKEFIKIMDGDRQVNDYEFSLEKAFDIYLRQFGMKDEYL